MVRRTASQEGPSPPPSPPFIPSSRTSVRAGDSSSSPKSQDENLEKSSLADKNRARASSLPVVLSAGAMEHRSALAPRTDANHVGQARNNSNNNISSIFQEKEEMAGVETSRRSNDTPNNNMTRGMTPPRPPPVSDTVGSISDLVKPSRSFDLPRNPRDPTSPKRRSLSRHIQATAPPREIVSAEVKSIHSQRSQRSARSSLSGLPPSQQPPSVWQWMERQEPDSQEQALFEQRLCEDVYGVAVRKINQNGKSNLRYVKCVPLDDASCGGTSDHNSTSRSVNSLVRSLSRRGDRQRDLSLDRGEAASAAEQRESHRNLIPLALNSNRKKALVWGKKKDIKLNVDRFVCVRKGKTNERTRRNPQPASRLLSLVSNDVNHPSLDIEAPTKLDRDKFARAFAKFLGVPLEGDDGGVEEYQSAASVEFSPSHGNVGGSKQGSTRSHPLSASPSAASDVEVSSKRSGRRGNAVAIPASPGAGPHLEISFDGMPVSSEAAQGTPPKASRLMMASQAAGVNASSEEPDGAKARAAKTDSLGFLDSSKQAEESAKADDASAVSSLTGAGFDQEIVEELHQALTDLRAELDGSRAEAARAVKVAEQAIQSAENSNSKDWNSTVTHKAAEAAAQAQKRSAEAMAKQRLAEERLAAERKSAAFWRKQAEAAEEEAGVLQTRAAAAEVQRAAMSEELESERRKAASLVTTMKQRYTASEAQQNDALESALERNRSLLIELDSTRRELELKSREANTMEEAQTLVDGKSNVGKNARKGFMGRKKKPAPEDSDPSSKGLLASEAAVSQSSSDGNDVVVMDQDFTEDVLRLHVETGIVRHQYDLLRRATADELRSLPAAGEQWANQVSKALSANQAELSRLREKLAVESATRRRLLHEVQDLRGVVRVYCRPRPLLIQDDVSSPKSQSSNATAKPILSVSSQETLLLHRDRLPNCQDASPMSFEFDGIFHDKNQKAVYSEMEELVLGVLDGYNVCIMAYGQTRSGKTHSILGDVYYDGDAGDVSVDIVNEGIQLQGIQQLFTVSERRSERYQDAFSLTIVEVHDERLVDLVAGTEMGDSQGRVQFDDSLSSSRRSSSRGRKRLPSEDEGSAYSKNANSSASKGKQTKLEIRTNHDGDTVVQGLISIPVHSYDDVLKVWHQALSQRAARAAEQDVELSDHEAESHVIATLKVVSTNIATGIGTIGKIHFVDLAGADLTTKRPPVGAKTKPTAPDPVLAGVGNNSEWKYVNKSLATLSEVVNARCQFNRSVPYRNSTLTHLLRDSLEADTKVLMLVCVSSDPKDAQATASALRFASKMRRVNIGKATKHTK